MSEISSPRPLPPAVPVIRNTATAADMAVRLLQPLEGMLAAGESAKAEVVAIREQAQSFQLLLKLFGRLNKLQQRRFSSCQLL